MAMACFSNVPDSSPKYSEARTICNSLPGENKEKINNSHSSILGGLPQDRTPPCLDFDSLEYKRLLSEGGTDSEKTTHKEQINSNNFGKGTVIILSLIGVGIIATPLISYAVSPEKTKDFFENTWEFLKKPTGHSDLPMGATIALCVIGVVAIGLILKRYHSKKTNNNENVVSNPKTPLITQSNSSS